MDRTGKLAFKPRLKSAERRVIIERAASELFAERGYQASSVEDIAEAAGVTKRVIYDHFRSKRALHITLLDKHADELIHFVAERAASGASARERMSAGVAAFFRFVEDHPYAWRMLFRDAPADATIASAYRAVQARATNAIAQLLAAEPLLSDASRAGGDRWLEMMAEQLKTALNGLAGWWYEHRDVPIDDVIAAAIDFGWTGLRSFAESR